MDTDHNVHPTSEGQRWRRRGLVVGGGAAGVYVLTTHGMCFVGAVLSMVLSAIMLTLVVGMVVAALDSAYERGGHLGEGYATSIGAMLMVAWVFAVAVTTFTVRAIGAWTGLDELPADVAHIARLIGVQRRLMAAHVRPEHRPTATRRRLRDPREDDR